MPVVVEVTVVVVEVTVVLVDDVVVDVVVVGAELPQALNKSAPINTGIKSLAGFEGRQKLLIVNEV